ncbi:hypothetical protein VNO77_04415 [Canavalia gladiata]|uniref:Uncharacterized protein n=1 Tax=Canavalia gladiata TaxID=3824 RepID=A0AAN9MWG9_CANGL
MQPPEFSSESKLLLLWRSRPSSVSQSPRTFEPKPATSPISPGTPSPLLLSFHFEVLEIVPGGVMCFPSIVSKNKVVMCKEDHFLFLLLSSPPLLYSWASSPKRFNLPRSQTRIGRVLSKSAQSSQKSSTPRASPPLSFLPPLK